MKTQFVTADELVQSLGISKGKAYQIIRQLNDELSKQGYIKIAGKCPRKYFEKRVENDYNLIAVKDIRIAYGCG